jgi:hypothetical protein
VLLNMLPPLTNTSACWDAECVLVTKGMLGCLMVLAL